MTQELSLLLIATISIAFIHTLTGPDHYLPFIVISKARKWSPAKTAWFTALCGLGHVGSSIILGFIGIGLGIAVGRLELIEGVRGNIISWIFTAFGLMYLIWGIRHAIRNKPHEHVHFHGAGNIHIHAHNHHDEHLHVHENKDKQNITPWILFTIFIFGPCEPLIPLVMYPAAKHNYNALLLVTIIFSVVTILTMLSLVLITSYGIKFLPIKVMEKYNHALAGGTIFLCGMGMLFLGL
ncbi:MAG: sulfite exporter TauE/SafE family protein [Smithellaceae bacterium]|nr:sulfite exporter TauE/SafE family protein [Smithellaceae bacterium]